MKLNDYAPSPNAISFEGWPLKITGIDVIDGEPVVKANGNWFLAKDVASADRSLSAEINRFVTVEAIKAGVAV